MNPRFRHVGFSAWMILAALSGSCDDAPEVIHLQTAPVATAPQSDPEVALFTFGKSVSGSDPRRLIFAAEADGRVVWSENRIVGGDPLREGRLAQARLTALRDELADAAREFGEDEALFRGPDAPFTILRFRYADVKKAEFQTWHELMEAPGRVVANERGLVPAGEAANADPGTPDALRYVKFRKAWRKMREAIERAISDADPSTPLPQQ